MDRLGLCLCLALCAVWWSACPSRAGVQQGSGSQTAHDRHAAPLASAQPLRRADQLPHGPQAQAQLGDLALRNRDTTFVLRRLGFDHQSLDAGGGLIDASARGGLDLLAGLHQELVGPEGVARRVLYHQAEPSQEGGRAWWELQGRDAQPSSLEITTRLTLEPQGRALLLETTLRNQGQEPSAPVTLAERWRGAQARLWGQEAPRAWWVAGQAQGVAYAWRLHQGEARAQAQGEDQLLILGEAAPLAPGEERVWRRTLLVGAPPELLKELGLETQAFSLRVRQGDQPSPGAEILLRPPGSTQVAMVLQADPRGEAQVQLPGEGWRAQVQFVGSPPAAVTLRAGGVQVLEAAPPSGVALSALDERGGAVEARVTAVPVGGGDAVVATVGAQGAFVPLAPGAWRVVVSRGHRYEWATRELSLEAGQRLSLRLSPALAWEAPGWVAADLHQPFEGPTQPLEGWRAFLEDNLAEGVQLVGPVQPGQRLDPRPAIEAQGWQDRLVGFPGVLVKQQGRGAVVAQPWLEEARGPGGAPVWGSHGEPWGLLRALEHQGEPSAMVQLLDPMEAAAGYGAALRRWPGSPEEGALGMHALEVMTASGPGRAREALGFWFEALSQGRVVMPTAGSGQGQRPGAARTWWRLGEQAPAAQDFLAAVRQQRAAVASTGPFVDVQMDGEPMGSVLPLAQGGQLRVRVKAASWAPLTQVEVIHNGRVVAARGLAQGDLQDLDWVVPVDRSQAGWWVVLARGATTMEPVSPGLKPWAVTSPIWVTP